MPSSPDSADWLGVTVEAGTQVTRSLVISENYSGANVSIPVHVWRGRQAGPTVCVTAAVHGDEINGTGTIRHIIRDQPFDLVRGTLVLVPVVNMMGFERHTRYSPDRRDLNRSFPGSTDGSLAGRMAHAFFRKVIKRCDYGIDLHTAAVRRTNFPNVRADLSRPGLAEFARAFGAELILNNKGPRGSLRGSACRAGCEMLILEAGEVWKVEPGVVEYTVRGIQNCLRFLEMVDGRPEEPAYRLETDRTQWVRAKHGGFLEFHIAPGDIVEKGSTLATNTALTGAEQGLVIAPRSGIVLGMTTSPCVAPGDPVCHLAFPRKGALTRIERIVDRLSTDSLHERVRDDLTRGMLITKPQDPT